MPGKILCQTLIRCTGANCVVPYAGMTPIRFSGFHRSGLSLDFRLWRPDKPVQCKRSRVK